MLELVITVYLYPDLFTQVFKLFYLLKVDLPTFLNNGVFFSDESFIPPSFASIFHISKKFPLLISLNERSNIVVYVMLLFNS